jgi:hypothetical protein
MEGWLCIVTEDMMGCNHREERERYDQECLPTGNREWQSAFMKDELYDSSTALKTSRKASRPKRPM